tara:strand:+ start:34 stop:732 length:699 start_codon:yes stop_codon:yes gene_type:complete
MSEIKVNKISPATGTEITLGDTSDKFIVPSGAELEVASGATITNSGTATNFGGAAGWTLLNKTVVSTGVNAINFTSVFSSTYEIYKFFGFGIQHDGAAYPYIQLMDDTTVQSSNYNMRYLANYNSSSSSGTHAVGAQRQTGGWKLNNNWNNSATSGDNSHSHEITFYNPQHASISPTCHCIYWQRDNSYYVSSINWGEYESYATGIDGFKYYLNANNISAGTFLLYGLKNSV